MAGESMHTAQWRDDVDIAGKRVAVVGSGASAAQVSPEIAKVASHLHVFMRSAPYCSPRNDGPTEADTAAKLVADDGDAYVREISGRDAWRDPPVAPSMFRGEGSEELRAKTERYFHKLVRDTVKDPEVAEKLIPTYPVGCKRLPVVDDYYPMFNRSNVTLTYEPSGLRKINEQGPVGEDGTQYDVDVIVFATGV